MSEQWIIDIKSSNNWEKAFSLVVYNARESLIN